MSITSITDLTVATATIIDLNFKEERMNIIEFIEMTTSYHAKMYVLNMVLS